MAQREWWKKCLIHQSNDAWKSSVFAASRRRCNSFLLFNITVVHVFFKNVFCVSQYFTLKYISRTHKKFNSVAEFHKDSLRCVIEHPSSSWFLSSRQQIWSRQRWKNNEDYSYRCIATVLVVVCNKALINIYLLHLEINVTTRRY